MDRLISEQYLIEHLKACFENGRPMYRPTLDEVLEMIKTIPSADNTEDKIIRRTLENFMRGLWEEIQVGELEYTTSEVYEMLEREIFTDNHVAIPQVKPKILQKPLKCREAHCGAMCSPIIAESYCENPKECEFYERINDVDIPTQADGEYISKDEVHECIKTRWSKSIGKESAILEILDEDIAKLPSVAILSAEPYKGMTNGEVVKAVFPDIPRTLEWHIQNVTDDWWNSPYEPQESENKE